MAQPPGGAFEIRVLRAGAQPAPDEPGVYRVALETTRGAIPCLFHPCQGERGAVIFIGGARGGFEGPAGGLYPQLGQELLEAGVSSLRLHYREPNVFPECVLDVLAALSFLRALNITHVALVGHSFGGAVAIKAAVLAPDIVSAVVAMSSQLSGAEDVDEIAPRPILLVHGTADTVLEHRASELIYERAKEPKELVLYPRAGHGLRECAEELRALLRRWLAERVGREKLTQPT